MKDLVKNLKLAHKFTLIGVVMAVMLAVPSSLIVQTDLARLRSAQAELSGIEPLHDVLRLMQLTQQHRGLSASFLGGNESLGAARRAKQTEVHDALVRSRASLARLGNPKLTALASRIGTDWQGLAEAVGGKSLPGPQSFARHTMLIRHQLGLIEDITHACGIVLHPDASGYFLQSGVLAHMPALTETLGQMRAHGALLLARGEITPGERARLESLAGSTRLHYEDIRKSLNLALETNPAMRDEIAAPLAAAMTATEEGLKLVDEKILRAERLSLPSGDYFAATTRVIDAQFKLIATAFKSLDDLLQGQVAQARGRLIAVLGSIGLLSALALWLMWLITRTTTASVGAALRLAQAVGDGDLGQTVEATGQDEIGQLLRALGAMNDGLIRVVGGVRENAEGVATASSQIAQGNQDLSQRTEQQACALEETAASMEELGSTVRQNADNARQANQLAQGASSVAVKGGEVVGQVVEMMRSINDSSKKIADIIGVIDGIAFQTNILALNAAVEAARAGEQGRGFAVVASEVRNLAQRSGKAAKEIKGLISASVERVEHGTALVDQAGATMSEIVASIRRLTDIMGEISAASTEQSAGVSQVGEAVSQMDQVTQRNAALVEESAAAAASLQSQAQQLVRTVAVFRLAPAPGAPLLSLLEG